MKQKINENRMVDAFNDYAFLNNIMWNLFACGFSHMTTSIGEWFFECCCFCDSKEEAQQAYDIMKRVTGERGEYQTFNHNGDFGVCYYVLYKFSAKNRFEKDC